MSVNRLEITQLLICAPAQAFMDADVDPAHRLTMIVDLEDSGRSETAWSNAAAMLKRRDSGKAFGPVLLRIAVPDDHDPQEAIARLAALKPDGIVLSGCRGAADVQRLDVMLRVAEAENGLEPQSVAILAEIGRSADALLSPRGFRGVSDRLTGLIFDAGALSPSHDIDSKSGAPLVFARAVAVLKAAQAEIPCYELLADRALAGEALEIARDASRIDGFDGIIARSVAQLPALA